MRPKLSNKKLTGSRDCSTLGAELCNMQRRILTVDDNALSSWALKLGLEAAGYDITLTLSASKAFAILRDQVFDFILLDLNMPVIDGLAALRHIKQELLAPATPVMLLTASDELIDIVHARELGAAGYLTKEGPLDRIAERIDRFFAAPDTVWMDDYTRVSDPAWNSGEAPSQATRTNLQGWRVAGWPSHKDGAP